MSELRDRVAIVTGAARGIGFKIAERLASSGAIVCIADINAVAGEEAASRLRVRFAGAEFFATDLSVPGAAQEAVSRAVKRHGRIDILVNNARSGTRAGLLEETETTWDETLAVTLRAAFFASQEAIRHMQRSRSGNIVTIGSIAGLLVTSESPSYHIAKAGVIQLTRYLAVAGGAFGVRANGILPGFIVQDEHLDRFNSPSNLAYRRTAEACQPLGAVGESADVAELVHFLSTPAAKYLSGESIVLDGGATRLEQFGLLRRHMAP